MSVGLFLIVAAAGGAGAGLRYLVDVLVTARTPARFPLGIFVVNAVGSFVLGLVTALAGHVFPGDVATILGTGLLGGFTTFSTVSVDTALLFGDGEARRAWLNVAGTAVVCVAAAAVGIGLGALVM